MTPELWEEVEALFGNALEKDPSERETFVRSAARIPEIATEVLALLEAHERKSPFDGLDRPTRLGPWEIQSEIGRGGMGTVYRVRRADGQFEQEAAVKILSAHIRDRGGEARFLAERQLLAGLQHPCIARLLDGGLSEEGLPYFVMEYVPGLPIHEYCRKARLGVDEILDLFVQVCGAVQYAHQNLIVHRDLKPSNILVTAAGEPKLLDFGIAKLLDDAAGADADLTRFGARPLTPGYAAPEQLGGAPVTTSTDVYQLGVLLHEILVGRKPTGGDGWTTGSSADRASTGFPALPSRLVLSAEPRGDVAASEGGDTGAPARIEDARRRSRRLRGDLDSILLKALRPEPDRRYGTAGELADDISRHRARRPVRARRDTLLYRASSFLRRNALPLIGTAGAFLLISGFALGMERQARITAVERDRAEEVIDLMVGLFRGSDPAVAQGSDVTVREILDVGAERVRSGLEGQGEVRATLLEVVAEVYGSIDLMDPAIDLMAEAVEGYRSARGPDSPDLARSVRRLAMFQAQAGRFEEADTLLPLAWEMALSTTAPGSTERARAANDIGYAWQVRGELDKAEPLLVEALALRMGGGTSTGDPAATLVNLGWLRRARNDPDSAEVLFRKALALRRASGGGEELALASALEALARVLSDQGAFEAADSTVAEALAIRRALLPEGDLGIAALVSLEGNLLRRRGRPAEAEPLLREALEDRIEALGVDHFLVAEARNDLALAFQDQGNFQDALALLRRAWEGYRAWFGGDHSNTAVVETNLARLLMGLGQVEEAEERFAHALPTTRSAFPEARWVLGDQVSLGFLRCRPETLPQALGGLRDARDALRPTGGEAAPDEYLRAVNALASCLARHGSREEALSTVRESLEASGGRDDQDPYRAFALGLMSELQGEGR